MSEKIRLSEQQVVDMIKRIIREEVDNREGRYKILLQSLQSLGSGLMKATSSAAIAQYQKDIEATRKEMQAIEQAGIKPSSQQYSSQQPQQGQQPQQSQQSQQGQQLLQK